MRLVTEKVVEDCFDETFIIEYLLDKPINKDFIDYLGQNCNLEYYPKFAKPFFKVECIHKYIIKGIEEQKTLRVIYNRANIEQSKIYLKNYVEKF